MVFHAIGTWLLIAAIPLWLYRWYAYARLDPRERQVFRRLLKHRHEKAVVFALRIFGFLVALAIGLFVVVFGLRYLKYGSLEFSSFSELIHSRLYSGYDPFDRLLDQFHYQQPLPLAVLTTCLLLSIAFTLVASAFRDISLINKLKSKLESRKSR
jgi:hypothetical protein